jgi:hypothetical protein
VQREEEGVIASSDASRRPQFEQLSYPGTIGLLVAAGSLFAQPKGQIGSLSHYKPIEAFEWC